MCIFYLDKNARSFLHTFGIGISLFGDNRAAFFVRQLRLAHFLFFGGVVFFSLSKTIARLGGFRLGIGVRLNKKNAVWLFLVITFVATFQLMWYTMVFCGWLVYAFCYGIYWCVKKIIKALTRPKTTTSMGNSSTQDFETKGKEGYTPMSYEKKHPERDEPKRQVNKQKSGIARWIIGGVFASFVLVTGFHYSSLFLLAAAFLMFPLPFMIAFWQKRNIKAVVSIILSVALLFVGVLTSPSSDPADLPSSDTTEAAMVTTGAEDDTSAEPESTIKKNDETTEPANTTAENMTKAEDTERVIMVWVTSSGSKYHSNPSCSNMKSPRQISLEEAEKQGLTACKNCH